MKILVNINKKYFFGILVAMFLLIGVLVAFAYDSSFKSNDVSPSVAGHSANEVNVKLSDGVMSLQQAIESGKFGSGGGYTVLVRHNMTPSPTPPACPDGWTKLWTGYSFAGGYLSADYESGQMLGDPGSCLETFTPLPIIQCDNPKQCDYYTSKDYAMWLTTYNSDQPPISEIDNIIPIISRCSVCEKPAPVLVRHNITPSPTPPACPDGWTKLWTGYSFMGGYGGAGYESGQRLGDPGSCLETFNPVPVIECYTPDHCEYFTGNDYGIWLTTNNVDQNPIGGIKNIISNISRCTVCSK